MSITGFQDAIKDQVSHYDDTVNAIRSSNQLQRSNALAGIQSEVEKYGEIAKLGLEFPMAIEGTKAAVAVAKKGFKFAKGLKNAAGEAKDALSNITDQLSGGPEGAAARIRSAVPSYDSISDRFDALRANGEGYTGGAGDRLSSLVTEPRAMAGPDIELPATDDMNPSSFRNQMTAPDPYGADLPDEVRTTSTRVPLDATGGTGTAAPVEADAPVGDSAPVEKFLGRDTVARPTPRPPAPEVDDDPDDPVTQSRPGDIQMGDQDSGPSMVRQNSSGYNEVNRAENPDFKPPRPTSKAPGPAEGDSDAISPEPTEAPPPVPTDGIEPEIAPVLEDATAEGGGEIGGGILEGLGAAFLGSGVFAPLGALMEGLGALTEVTSLGVGAYGAVQSMVDAGKEEALRKAPMAAVSGGNLDIGGSVAAPELN